MALLPRLPADAEDTTVTITVNKKLAPYYREWFQNTKEAGESPSDFVIRILKPLVIHWYLDDTNLVIAVDNEETWLDAQALSEEVSDIVP